MFPLRQDTHSHGFSALGPVMSLCIECCPPQQEKAFLAKVEHIPDILYLWSCSLSLRMTGMNVLFREEHLLSVS